MNSPLDYKSDDGGFTPDEQVLHDVIHAGIKAGLMTRWTPQNVAIRIMDRKGAIAKQDRELLDAAYPELFLPAKPKKAAEIVFPQP